MARELSPIAKIEQDHPPFPDDYARMMLVQTVDYLSPCLERNYEAAFAIAKSERAKEEIALAQAILGDTDLAIQSTSRLSESFRRENVQFVVAIELYRQNRMDQAAIQLEKQNTLSERDSALMALGVSNRVPWLGYPFPDW